MKEWTFVPKALSMWLGWSSILLLQPRTLQKASRRGTMPSYYVWGRENRKSLLFLVSRSISVYIKARRWQLRSIDSWPFLDLLLMFSYRCQVPFSCHTRRSVRMKRVPGRYLQVFFTVAAAHLLPPSGGRQSTGEASSWPENQAPFTASDSCLLSNWMIYDSRIQTIWLLKSIHFAFS